MKNFKPNLIQLWIIEQLIQICSEDDTQYEPGYSLNFKHKHVLLHKSCQNYQAKFDHMQNLTITC